MINNKEKNFISAIVYMSDKNQSCEVIDFLKKLNQVLETNFNKYEIICVNDITTEATLDAVKELADSLNSNVLSVINMSFYQGLEASMKAGIDFAIGDFVYEFDTTYVDYDMDLVMQVYKQSLKGFDIVNAIPKSNIRLDSKLFYKIYNNSVNSRYSLQTQTFRIISRRGINRVHAMNKTIPYRKAIYANCGLNIYFLKYDEIKKQKDRLMKHSESVNLAIDSLILFTNVAYKMSFAMAIFFFISLIVVIGYTISVFLSKTPVAGWTTTMLFMSFAFLGIFGFFAIIIKYLSLIIDLIFRKQEYIIKSVEKLTK